MGASAIEFRLRMVINAAIIILGFWAPWIERWHIGRRMSLLEWLALELSRTGVASFAVATSLLLIIAALIAAKAVLFRVWGTAYLGADTVNSASMLAGKVMADGPYRYVRNPLYIGLWCMVIAMTFLMPATGAAFSAILITIFAIRLTLGEEAFLSVKLGEPYMAYLKRRAPLHSTIARSTFTHRHEAPLGSCVARRADSDRRACCGSGRLAELRSADCRPHYSRLFWGVTYHTRLPARRAGQLRAGTVVLLLPRQTQVRESKSV